MKFTCRIGSLFMWAFVSFIVGCGSDAQEAKKIADLMERDNPDQYLAVLVSFVDRAREGDIEGMIALTCDATIKHVGIEKVKERYKKDTSPALKIFSEMSDGGEADYINDGKGRTGWVYKKLFTASDGKTTTLQFVIVKENGVIAVFSINAVK